VIGESMSMECQLNVTKVKTDILGENPISVPFAHHKSYFNPLNTELNPTCHLLALLGAHHIFHVSGLRVNRGLHGENAGIHSLYNSLLNSV
jgi:hypothetical protein